MEESLLTVLKEHGVATDALRVDSVVLNRRTNVLSVSFGCGDALPEEEQKRIGAALSRMLPELSVRTAFVSDRACRPVPAPAPAPVADCTANAVRPVAPVRDPNAPKILMGGEIRGYKLTPVHELDEGERTVVIEGTVVSFEEKEGWANKNGNANPNFRPSFRAQVNVTDGTDSIYCVCSFYEEAKRTRFMELLGESVKAGERLRVRGVCRMPKYAKEIQIFTNDVNAVPGVRREDSAAEKRVELHLHTRMSSMDGLTDVTAAVEVPQGCCAAIR